MSKLLILTAFLFLFTLGSVASASIVDEVKSYNVGEEIYVNLNDGAIVVGRILEIGDDAVKIIGDLGELTIKYSKIKQVSNDMFAPADEGDWFANPNQVRLFFAPTGRCMKKGQAYISDIEIFFPNAAYAFTDNISMGFGMSVFPGVDLSDQLYFITPKIGIKASDNLSLALGSFIMGFPEEFDSDNENITIGMLFGMATYGTADKSLTFGLGTGFADGEMADRPLVIVGGEYRLGRKLSIVSENWILPGVDGGMISGGLRFFGREMAVDLALFTNVGTEGDDSIVLPYLDFVFFFDI